MACKPTGAKQNYGHPGKPPGSWEWGTMGETICSPRLRVVRKGFLEEVVVFKLPLKI